MYNIVPSNQFKKDLRLAKKRGFPMDELRRVVNTLAAGRKLSAKHKDHSLSGNYNGFRECHATPDWLLVYRIEKKELELFLFRTGTHSDLFKA